MIGIPMEIVGPVAGFGAIILFISAGVVIVRVFTAKLVRPQVKSPAMDPTEHGRVLEDIQQRLGELDDMTRRMAELEERVDFAERILATQREQARLGPSKE